MALEIDRELFEKKGRIAGLNLINLNLRFMESWKNTRTGIAGGTDCVTALILMAIVAIGSGRLLRSNDMSGYESLAVPLDPPRVGYCNLSSIAAATGLNRETVRRRISSLQAAGLVSKADDSGIRLAPGLTQSSIARRLLEAQLESVTFAASRLMAAGLIRDLADRPSASRQMCLQTRNLKSRASVYA